MSKRSVLLALTGLIFAALTLLPAGALAEGKSRPGGPHSQTRHQYCLGDRSWCYGACDDVDNVINGGIAVVDPFFLGNCEQACNDAMDACEAAPLGALPGDNATTDTAGALVEQTTVQLDPVSEPKVKGVCGRVAGAYFASAEGDYGCINPACGDKGGVCTITCIKGKCFGSMPGKSFGQLTLLGILQGGSAVLKTPVVPDLKGGASQPGGGGNTDGGGVIIF